MNPTPHTKNLTGSRETPRVTQSSQSQRHVPAYVFGLVSHQTAQEFDCPAPLGLTRFSQQTDTPHRRQLTAGIGICYTSHCSRQNRLRSSHHRTPRLHYPFSANL